ncbi:hypothetical protein APTSU1_000196800 [Apodemus speciosus]|uniref:Uncharacterized protein n=1 Tax=Apodemus speciosus TaxID=105296 RepID=A0ABQ0EI07_APOSI
MAWTGQTVNPPRVAPPLHTSGVCQASDGQPRQGAELRSQRNSS